MLIRVLVITGVVVLLTGVYFFILVDIGGRNRDGIKYVKKIDSPSQHEFVPLPTSFNVPKKGNSKLDSPSISKKPVREGGMEVKVRSLVDRLRRRISGVEDQIEALGVNVIPTLLKILEEEKHLKDEEHWRLHQRLVYIIADIAHKERGMDERWSHVAIPNDYHPSGEKDPLHQAALYFITRIEEYLAVDDNKRADREISSTMIYALGAIGDFAATDLLLSLAEGCTNTHGGPISALAALGDPKTLDFFVNMIYDERYHDSGPCGWAVPVALARIGDKRAVPHLLHALKNRCFELTSIIGALGELKDESAVPKIAEYLRTGDYVTTSSACRALRKIGTPLAEQLLWELADEAADALPEYTPMYKRKLLEKEYGPLASSILTMKEYKDGRVVRTVNVREKWLKCDERETVPGFEERYYALMELARMGDRCALGEFILHIRKGLTVSGGDLSNKYRLNWMIAWDSALKSITGEDFGKDIDAWERWWHQNSNRK